jgi:hypothetical protein
MANAPTYNVPIPDPTELTSRQLRREIEGLQALLETRLDAIDKATTLFQDNLTRVPTDVEKQITHLRALHDEKFESIQTQFAERDGRARASETAANTAVNAALSAQKEAAAAQNASNAEAIRKSETATQKQIDATGTMLTSVAGALTDKIDTINGRINRGDGAATGSITIRDTSHQNNTTMISIAALCVSLLVGLLSVGIALYSSGHHDNQPQPVFQTQPLAPVVVPDSARGK